MQSNVLKSRLALAKVSQQELQSMMQSAGVNIDLSTLNLKINGRREFKQSEIMAIINALKLSNDDAMSIFFATNVS